MRTTRPQPVQMLTPAATHTARSLFSTRLLSCAQPLARHSMQASPDPQSRRSTVSMNTQYSDPYAFQKKKNAKSGRGELLKGYTVGSLAPGVAVKSGTTISEMGTSYGAPTLTVTTPTTTLPEPDPAPDPDSSHGPSTPQPQPNSAPEPTAYRRP